MFCSSLFFCAVLSAPPPHGWILLEYAKKKKGKIISIYLAMDFHDQRITKKVYKNDRRPVLRLVNVLGNLQQFHE